MRLLIYSLVVMLLGSGFAGAVERVPIDDFVQMRNNFFPLDISGACNRAFKDEHKGDGKGGWSDQGENDLRSFPVGKQVFLGVTFEIVDPAKNKNRSCIVTRGQSDPFFPTEITFPVKKKTAGIYFLHTAAWARGSVLGSYTVTYADKKKVEIPLYNGKRISDWWGASDMEEGSVAWKGENPINQGVGVFMFSWENPHPDKEIASITVASPGDGAYIGLIGVTLTDVTPVLPYTPREVVTDMEVDMSEWIPFTKSIDETKAKSTAIDVSFVLHKPAGKRGFVKVDGDHFVFEDGTIARFWGLNSVSDAYFPDKELADYMSDQLSRIGCNIVRIHHMDADWNNPKIFKGNDSTLELDPETMDKLDYFLAKCIEKGIYIYFDLLCARVAKPGDSVPDYENMEGGWKKIAEFEKRLKELQKAFIKDYLTHKNPYTGRRYVDEPAVAMMEIINEDSLFHGGLEARTIKSEYCRGVLTALWNDYVAEKYNSADDLMKAWKQEGRVALYPGEDFDKKNIIFYEGKREELISKPREKDKYDFLYAVQTGYYKEFEKYLRSIGVKCPITGSNLGVSYPPDIYSNLVFEKDSFLDRHAYWSHPSGYGGLGEVSFTASPMIKSKYLGMVGSQTNKRALGYPYIVTEWQCGQPNQFVIEGSVLMASYFALHGWHGVQFAYKHHLPKKGEAPMIHAAFDIYNHPNMLGIWPATALMYLRGDIKEAKETVAYLMTEEDVMDPDGRIGMKSKAGLICKTGIQFADKKTRKDVDKQEKKKEKLISKYYDEKTDTVTDAGKQLTFNRKAGILTINTDNTQGFVGFPVGTQACDNIKAIMGNKFCSVMVNSLTDDPIRTSSRMLLTAVARAWNKGMKYATMGENLISLGTSPIMVEPVVGSITLMNVKKPSSCKVYALSFDGERTGEVPVDVDNKDVSFELTAENKAIHYEIVIK